jgi:hypothetical protein
MVYEAEIPCASVLGATITLKADNGCFARMLHSSATSTTANTPIILVLCQLPGQLM